RAILHGGDFWDSPLPSIAVASEFLNVWKRWTGDIYIVPGNHDLFGNNIQTLPRTMLGLMASLDVVKIIHEDTHFIFQEGDFKVAVTGIPYHNDIDKPGCENDYIVGQKLGDIHIHIVHGMLSLKKMGDIIRHTLIDDIKQTNADITLSGHEHIGFEKICINQKYFLNPGAIARLNNNIKEVGRMPNVVMIDIDKNNINMEIIPLKTAQPGDQVLDRSKLEEIKFKEEKFAEFKKLIRDAGHIEEYGAYEIINSIADKKNIDKKVRDEAINRIAHAKEVMG
ncbi:MAG: metallophosphoesterase family protein, partial [Clostridia bacterium]|nr:metallophosphoesterase family protein [Clostridia bacterium]